MAATAEQPSRDRKIYGFILMLGALIQLILLAISILSTPGHFRQLGGTIELIAVFTIILFTYIIIGYFALRARKPETVFVLRLATIIGLFCGSALGILMAIFASRPHEAGLGIFVMTIMPFSILQIPSAILHMLLYTGITRTGITRVGAMVGAIVGSLLVWPLVLTLHILAFLGMGIGGFWVAKRIGSVKYGVWSTLLIAMTTTLFILYSGLIYALIFPSLYLPLSNYTNVMTLFLAPLIPLLLYALISGTIGAFLSRLGCSRSMQNS